MYSTCNLNFWQSRMKLYDLFNTSNYWGEHLPFMSQKCKCDISTTCNRSLPISKCAHASYMQALCIFEVHFVVLSLSHSSSNNFSLCAIIWLTLNLLIIASPQWQSKGWNAPASLEESITWWAMPTHVGGLSTTYIIKSVWSSLIKMLSVCTHSTLPTHAIIPHCYAYHACMLCIQYYTPWKCGYCYSSVDWPCAHCKNY